MSNLSISTKRRRILNELELISSLNSEESENVDIEQLENDSVDVSVNQEQGQFDESIINSYYFYIFIEFRKFSNL